MRTAFIDALIKAAHADDKIWLLTGDLGYSVLEPFRAAFPDRYINAGVAEQNMIGVAAGLALSGAQVFVYSICNFVTLRCLEQIRNDLCYHKANVKVVGVGSGLSYGVHGYTHHAVEDIAVTRALPNMTVLCPGDPVEARWAAEVATCHNGPAYIRIGKAGEPALHAQPLDGVALGKAVRLREGDDATLFAVGNMLESTLKAAALLEAQGFGVGVVSMPCVKPLDEAFVAAEAARVPLVATVEEHVQCGGFGEAIAGVMARSSGARARLLSFAVGDAIVSGLVGDQNHLRNLLGLSPQHIADGVTQALGAKR